MRAKSHKAKGKSLAVSILLDLGQAVTVLDLRQFLSWVPEGFDVTQDLRLDSSQADIALLEIPLPLSVLGSSSFQVTRRVLPDLNEAHG